MENGDGDKRKVNIHNNGSQKKTLLGDIIFYQYLHSISLPNKIKNKQVWEMAMETREREKYIRVLRKKDTVERHYLLSISSVTPLN